MPDGFRTAVFSKLNGDVTLTAMLATSTSFYHRRAPKDAAFPYVVYFKSSPGVCTNFFAGPPIEDQVWTFKAVDRWFSSGRAEDIDKRMTTVLSNPVMTLSDGSLLYLNRENGVDYEDDTDPDSVVHHVGGLYRTMIDRTVV